jgi:16S rRNA (guanine(527)-N(7))-methyltransferase RsmG
MVKSGAAGAISPAVWQQFCEQEQLTARQQEQFKRYAQLLMEWNNKFNITAITNGDDIVRDHFQDSLALRKFIDLSGKKGVADIGSGGGFPGIPLKICFPEIPFVLIEVNNKKVQFLQEVIKQLELSSIEVNTLEWRRFLKETDYALDLFTARASLQPEELVKVLSPAYPYAYCTLVYWASDAWSPSDKVKSMVQEEESYRIGNKRRKLVLLRRASSDR